MAKFHINPGTGEINKCRALFKPCPFDQRLHFNSKYEASSYLDSKYGELERQQKIVRDKYERAMMEEQERINDNQVNRYLQQKVGHEMASKMKQNKSYSDVINSFFNTSFGDDRLRNYGLEKFYDKNPGFFITEMNEAEAEAICDIAEVMENTKFKLNTERNFESALVNRVGHIRDAIEATRSLGIDIKKYNFYTQANDNAGYKIYDSLKVDEYGEINNFYYLGEEAGTHFEMEPSRVTNIKDGYIYTEDRPEGFRLKPVKKIIYDDGFVRLTSSRVIFYIDESAEGEQFHNDDVAIYDDTPYEYNYSEIPNLENSHMINGYRGYDDMTQGRDNTIKMKNLLNRKDMGSKEKRSHSLLSLRTSYKHKSIEEEKAIYEQEMSRLEKEYEL